MAFSKAFLFSSLILLSNCVLLGPKTFSWTHPSLKEPICEPSNLRGVCSRKWEDFTDDARKAGCNEKAALKLKLYPGLTPQMLRSEYYDCHHSSTIDSILSFLQ